MSSWERREEGEKKGRKGGRKGERKGRAKEGEERQRELPEAWHDKIRDSRGRGRDEGRGQSEEVYLIRSNVKQSAGGIV